MLYRALIRDIPDFPKPGIIYRDITPVLRDPRAFRRSVDDMAVPFREHAIDAIVAIEARGYFFGAPLARELGAGFVPIRKKGKLPWETISSSYELEYGHETVEMHVDSLQAGERVLLVDDVLATGGTLAATVDLVERSGAEVAGIAVFIELDGLEGRYHARLKNHRLHALLTL